MPNRYDDLQRRCPRLGSAVTFHYCRTCGNDPCFKVFDCWWEQFDVAAYFRSHLSEQDFQRIATRTPPDKTTSLVELIRQAQERIARDSRS